MVDARSSESIKAARDEDSIEYRSMEPWALVAAVLGAVSAVAFVAPMLWLVPILGIAAACIALLRMRDVPERTGRGLAVAGLALSLFCLAAPVARSYSTDLLLGRQARWASDQFLTFLIERSPEKAVMLHVLADARQPLDDGLWAHLRSDLQAQDMLRKLLVKPEVRMLLNLGPKAEVRFLRTSGVAAGHNTALASEQYAVTFTDAQGKKKTVLLGVLMERREVTDPAINPWRVRDIVTSRQPDGVGESL